MHALILKTCTDLSTSQCNSSVFDSNKNEDEKAEGSTSKKNLRLTLIDETAASSQCFLTNPI